MAFRSYDIYWLSKFEQTQDMAKGTQFRKFCFVVICFFMFMKITILNNSGVLSQIAVIVIIF